MSIRQQYNDIASIYDLLSEGDDGAIYFRTLAENVLKKLNKESHLLDCSCGTGDQAIWLARQGYSVFASDISESMLDMAIKKAERSKANIQFFRSSWQDLAKKYTDHFTLIMSPGNSFSHLDGIDMLKKSLKGIYLSLQENGIFIFDIRNWEKTFEESNLPEQEFEAGRRGSKMRVRYSWDLKGWNTICTMHVNTLNIKSSENTAYKFDFFPLSYEQLKEALLDTGFTRVDRQFYTDDNYYFVRSTK